LVIWDWHTLLRIHETTIFGVVLVLLVLAATLGLDPTPP
jgi:hypothetical protein